MSHSVQITLTAVKSDDTILDIILVSHVQCRVPGLSDSQSDAEIALLKCYLGLDFMILHIFKNIALRLLYCISVLLHPQDILFQL